MPDANFFTRDFGLATYLLTDPRITLVATEAVTPNRVRFTLAPQEICLALVSAYLSDKALVNPRILHDRSRLLKGILHAVRRGECQ